MAPNEPVVAAFWRHATEHPRQVAVRADGAEVTYGELAARAGRFAGLLRRRGTGPGDVVAVRLPRGADQVAAVVGIALSGAAYLPLDPAHPHGRAATVLRLAGPDVPLFAPPEEAGRWRAEGVETLAPAGDEPFTGPGDLPHDRPAYIVYTSGSTGEPKGVVIDHRALAVFTASEIDRHDLEPDDRVAMVASPGFDAAVFETWPALCSGATITVADQATVLQPGRLRDWLVAERVKVVFLTTAVGTPLLDLPWPPSLALRTLMVGGERLTTRPPHGLPFEVVNMYGPTETTVFTTGGRVDPDGEGFPSIGTPVAEARLRVVDADLRPVPAGEVGELHIGGPGVAVGYLHRPDLTAERFTTDDTDRWYRTGDLVRPRPDGAYDFVGRTDDQVKIRGNRIEPDELRATVEAHPDVVAAHVRVRHRDTPDAHLVAYVVGSPPGSVPPDLADHLRARLPAFLLPRHVVALPALPLSPNGKVDRAALPEPAAPAPADPGGPGLDEVETAVADVWRDVLKLDVVGRDDSFFDLGGHSLLLAEVHRRLTGELGYAVELVELFEHHTVRGLADRLRRGTADETRTEPAELASTSFRVGGRDRLRKLREQRRAATSTEGAQR